MLALGREGGLFGFAGGVSLMSALGHPLHDVRPLTGGVGDSLGDVCEGRRAFKDDYFDGTVHFAGQRDEAVYLRVDVVQVPVVCT